MWEFHRGATYQWQRQASFLPNSNEYVSKCPYLNFTFLWNQSPQQGQESNLNKGVIDMDLAVIVFQADFPKTEVLLYNTIDEKE